MRHYQESALRIAAEDIKDLLLYMALDHTDAEKRVSADSKIRTIFLPPSTTSNIQPMDLAVIVSCKRFSQRKYLHEVMVVIGEEEDLEDDTRGQRTLKNIKGTTSSLPCATSRLRGKM